MSELITEPDTGGEELSFEELESAAGGGMLEDMAIQSNCSGNCGCE